MQNLPTPSSSAAPAMMFRSLPASATNGFAFARSTPGRRLMRFRYDIFDPCLLRQPPPVWTRPLRVFAD
jgi:hypothetical protein